ncbi:MAG: hypothetical protein Kow0042_16510 [Calditrichia bacterium]
MKNKLLSLFIILISLGSSSYGANSFSHQLFDSLLQRYVEQGWVNYQGIKQNPQWLDRYLETIENLAPEVYENWTDNQKMAFWINAYNAITIKGILLHYPIQYGNLIARARFPQNSIRQISNFWDRIFVKPMGKEISLNTIEHQILRKEFRDPRIHFALVCASVGCPALKSRVYFAESLEEQLNTATREFIQDSTKNRLSKSENILYLSRIFDWYKEDFPAGSTPHSALTHYKEELRGILEFVMNYLPESEREYLLKNAPEIKFLEYDWSLNEKR